MKKLLGFFSILGITASISASSVTAFSENNLNWASPSDVLDSLNKIIGRNYFNSQDEFNNFMNSEIYVRFSNIINQKSDSIKDGDILLTYSFENENVAIFKASVFNFNEEKNELKINQDSVINREIIVNFI